MLIVWGKKKTTKNLGYVAEFCPVCRDITRCRVSRIGLAGHMWFISLSKGKLIGYLAKCSACGFEHETDDRYYAAFVRSRKTEVPQLIHETFPAIRAMRSAELDQAAKIRSGNMTQPERQQAITEGLALFAGKVDKLPPVSTITPLVGLCMVGTALALYGVGVANERQLFDRFPDLEIGTVYLGVFIAGVIVTMSAMIFTQQMHVRRHIVPVIARCLKPLRPAQPEVAESLGRFRAARMALGKRVPIDALMSAIGKAPQ